MKHWIKTLLIGAVVAAPLGAIAGVDNTHHDMQLMIGATSEKCAFCHAASVNVTPTYGSVGDFCVTVCHASGTVAQVANNGALPESPKTFPGDMETAAGDYAADWGTLTAGTANPNIFLGSHGYTKTSIPAPDAAADIAATGWPHVGEADIQCTSCHAVHDATNAPFLNAALSGFCENCHQGAATVDTAGRFGAGTHPTNIAYDVGNADMTMTAAPAPADPMLQRVTLFSDGTTAGVLTAKGDSWDTGGHLLDATSGLPTTTVAGATFGCYSCHSAHSDGLASLIMSESLQVMCYSCHGGEIASGTGDVQDGTDLTQENPGDTNYYHPVNTEVSQSALRVDLGLTTDYDDLIAAIAPAAADNVAPYCVSCHDVHGGRTGAKALRQINATTGPVVDFCGECHGGVANHHPIAAGDFSASGFPGTTPWNTSLVDGLSCSDCHGTNSSAHNW